MRIISYHFTYLFLGVLSRICEVNFKSAAKKWYKLRDPMLMLELTGLAKGRMRIAPDKKSKVLSKELQRVIAIRCYKLINSGEQLTSQKLDKIIIKVCLENKVKLFYANKSSQKEMEFLLKININDTPFVNSFNEYMKTQKRIKTPSGPQKSGNHASAKDSMSDTKNYLTFYSKTDLYCQSCPKS